MKVEEVKAKFDQKEKYLEGNTSILVRVNLINEMVRGISFINYLEVGCGDASIALSMLDDRKKLTLVDISDNMLADAKNKTPPALVKQVKYINHDICSYEFKEKYDLVICVGLLAHIPSIDDLISKIGSITNINGFLVLQYTERKSFFGWFNLRFMNKSDDCYEVNTISYSDLKHRLERAGFKSVSKRVYSDSNMGLRNLSFKLAYKFKLATSKLPHNFLFSEVILLLKKINTVG